MSNPWKRAERYRHVAIERLDGWVHSWWVCAQERRLSGGGDLRLAASAALRLRHGARAACKRLRKERDEARRERDRLRCRLAEVLDRLHRIRLPEPLLNGGVVESGNVARVALVSPEIESRPLATPEVQIVTFERMQNSMVANGVQLTWTTWRPVTTELVPQEDRR